MLGPMAGYDPLDIFSVQSTPVDYLQGDASARESLPSGHARQSSTITRARHRKAVKAALEVLTRPDRRRHLPAPLWEGLPGNGVGDADFYHHDLIEKYGMNYMPTDRPRFARLENPPAGTKPATAADAARDQQLLDTTRRQIDSKFKDFDLVVVPTTRLNPPRSTIRSPAKQKPDHRRATRWRQQGLRLVRARRRLHQHLALRRLRHPRDLAPLRIHQNGLPIGLMIAGPHFAEGKVLALAYAYQQATDWHKRQPPLKPDTVVPPIIEGKPDKTGDDKPAEENKKNGN